MAVVGNRSDMTLNCQHSSVALASRSNLGHTGELTCSSLGDQNQMYGQDDSATKTECLCFRNIPSEQHFVHV